MTEVKITPTKDMTRYDFEDYVVIVSADKQKVLAWTDKGHSSWYIKPSEKDMFRFNPAQAMQHMRHLVLKGIQRCSRCGWEGKREEFKFGQFADILCIACIEDDVKAVENDIKTGNICRLCRKPRHLCTC